MKEKNRFKIKRKNRVIFHPRSSHLYLTLLVVYVFLLFFLPVGRRYIEPDYTLDKDITTLCVMNKKVYVSSKREISTLDSNIKREFPFYILKMKVFQDKLIVTTDRVYVLDTSLDTLREFTRKDLFPEEIYIFKDSFGIKWRNTKGIDIAFSKFDGEALKETEFLDLKNTKTNVFASLFDNGNRIILFENNGNVSVFNFRGEILWNKNIRTNKDIVFYPTGKFDEDKKLMILYWKECIGGKSLLYLLNYDGDIIIKEEIRDGINDTFLYKNALYVLTKSGVIVKNSKKGMHFIPFYTPIYGESTGNNSIIVWRIEVPVYTHLLVEINGRIRFFMEGVDGITITENSIYIYKDSNIYIYLMERHER